MRKMKTILDWSMRNVDLQIKRHLDVFWLVYHERQWFFFFLFFEISEKFDNKKYTNTYRLIIWLIDQYWPVQFRAAIKTIYRQGLGRYSQFIGRYDMHWPIIWTMPHTINIYNIDMICGHLPRSTESLLLVSSWCRSYPV